MSRRALVATAWVLGAVLIGALIASQINNTGGYINPFNFFTSGGHSLLGAKLSSTTQKRLPR